MRDGHLFLLVFLYRAAVFLLLRTSYVPDEYYQYQEPAFKAAFPESPVELTWEWRQNVRLRSYLPLLPLIGSYKLSALLSDPQCQTFMMVLFPRALQAILAAISDIYLYKLARFCYNSSYAATTLMVHLFSWFGTYCLCRTLSNSTEHALLIIGTYYLCRRHYLSKILFFSISNFSVGMWIATFSVFVRPTIAMLWVPMFLFVIKQDSKIIVSKLAAQVAFIVQLGILVDTSFYGRFTFTPWNFFVCNILEKRAESFGVNSWHFYLANGAPTVLGFYFPYYVYGLTLAHVPRLISALANLSFWNVIGLMMFTRHAEHRFLLPLLPFFHLLIGWVVYSHCDSFFSKKANDDQDRSSGSLFFGKFCFSCIAILHIVAAIYLMHFHQAGPEKAFSYLREIRYQHFNNNGADSGTPTSIILGSSCFSFLGYSSLTADHYFKLINLPCLPPWEGKDVFNVDPFEGFSQLYSLHEQHASTMPAYILTFDSYAESLKAQTWYNKVTLIKEFDHAHFLYDVDDAFPKCKVLLYLLNGDK